MSLSSPTTSYPASTKYLTDSDPTSPPDPVTIAVGMEAFSSRPRHTEPATRRERQRRGSTHCPRRPGDGLESAISGPFGPPEALALVLHKRPLGFANHTVEPTRGGRGDGGDQDQPEGVIRDPVSRLAAEQERERDDPDELPQEHS